MKKKYKRALVFGTFDPLHFGHIRLFKRAKDIAEIVVACTENNHLIRKEKNRKPFSSTQHRVEDLKGIKYLDYVFVRTKKETREYIVKLFNPDVLILGSDWKDKPWVGKKLGIPIVYLSRTPIINSTAIRNALGIPKDKTV